MHLMLTSLANPSLETPRADSFLFWVLIFLQKLFKLSAERSIGRKKANNAWKLNEERDRLSRVGVKKPGDLRAIKPSCFEKLWKRVGEKLYFLAKPF